MASLYDGYQLSNTNQIKQFQGSAVPELMQVGQQLQNQYDTGKQYDDMIARMIPNTSSLQQDQPLLLALRDKYKQKIADRAAKGDYENMYRDTIMDSKDMVQEYKPIAENVQRQQAYQEDLKKQVEKGFITPSTMEGLLAASNDSYTGMKIDPVTGNYTNKFTGVNAAKDINVSEWIDKALDHFAARTNGRITRGIQGEYYVTHGRESTVLDQTQIDTVLNAAKKLDPEWQAYVKQQALINTVGYDKASDKDIVAHLGNMGQTGVTSELIDYANKANTTLPKAFKAYMQSQVEANLDNQARIYSSKFVRNDLSTRDEINGMTEEASARVHKKVEAGTDDFMTIASTTPGKGNVVKDAADFESQLSDKSKSLDDAMTAYSTWLKDVNQTRGTVVGSKDGHVAFKDKDGKMVDITDEATAYRNQINAASSAVERYNSVKQEAAREARFDSKALDAQANKIYEDKKAQLKKEGLQNVSNAESAFPTDNSLDPQEIERIAQQAKQSWVQSHASNLPQQAEYEAAIKRKLNPGAESSTLVMMNNKKTKDLWSSNLTAITSGLGLEKSAVSFKVGSGPDQGKDISSDQYDDLKGKMEIMGFDTDENGQTVLKARAFKNVRGTKTEGEDIVLNLPGTNADRYLQQNMPPDQFHRFKVTGAIKAGIGSGNGAASFEIPGTTMVAKIKREGDKFRVILPTDTGTREKLVGSYEGIYDLLNQVSDKYK